MLVDIGLSIGFVFAITFILGTYANNFLADRQHRKISYTDMIVIAAIGALLLLAFPAAFIFIGKLVWF